ncbi:MAG: hypothetical protein EZS28_037576 [Streblomastix strix]|uniref:Uncharacterized protein n=1 Tax=Streblomastix strix TaxID=222440 RepID=A0A5J4U8L9_9EUKA|nr:MAG: hypothetical protein EZS28_037576 [Streblomastix strix]
MVIVATAQNAAVKAQINSTDQKYSKYWQRWILLNLQNFVNTLNIGSMCLKWSRQISDFFETWEIVVNLAFDFSDVPEGVEYELCEIDYADERLDDFPECPDNSDGIVAVDCEDAIEGACIDYAEDDEEDDDEKDNPDEFPVPIVPPEDPDESEDTEKSGPVVDKRDTYDCYTDANEVEDDEEEDEDEEEEDDDEDYDDNVQGNSEDEEYVISENGAIIILSSLFC